jgi:class 3 adenylate cyclase
MATVRGGSLRARLTRTLVGLGLVSVLLLAAVNFVVVRGLLDRGASDQLTAVRDMRREAVELGIDRLLTEISVLGGSGLASVLTDVSDAYHQIDEDLTDEQLADLEAAYEPVVARYDEAGVDRPPIAELLPASTAGRYVQYHYIASQPAEERGAIVDAGDGSEYSVAHAEQQQLLEELAASVGASDLLLVDSASAEVVYSVDKHIDIGTNVETGPYADTGLGSTWAALGRAAVNDAVMSDSAYYLPSSTAPLVHVAATVRAGSEVVGAVIVTIEIDVLTTIVTAGQQWDQLGLGDTGEAYLIGSDLRLRTVTRPWFDDGQAGYVDRYLDSGGDERTAGLMEFTESPVMLQTVDNEATRAAVSGDDFNGRVDNYFGESTLTAAGPITSGDLGWVVVTEQNTSETRNELERFAISIAILLAVLLPILAVVGIVLARVLAKPVGPLVAAAGRIADGDYRTEVPDLGPTELGDVGRQLEAVAGELREREASIDAEETRITEMLSSVLPPALVELVRSGDREFGDVVDTGTVIAVTVRGLPEPSASDQDVMAELISRATDDLGVLVRRHGVERARISPEHLIFVAGRGMPEHDAANAASFGLEAVALVERLGAELGLGLTGHGGLALGLVASGLLGSQQVAYGVWGDCVGRAVALSWVAGPGEVLADAQVVEELDESWNCRLVEDDRGWGRPDGEAFALEIDAVGDGVDEVADDPDPARLAGLEPAADADD